ncbi:hypothetical protein F8203_gp173 [Heliothis virescens ascovirus 3f]|uniref:Uncharacterized protein n=1 Tax=Heliothis virescens ascovirus 3f TaxID=328614 RepID=A0A171PVS0_9VIRU|nr:hypothetical protein F8203_gp173 [Heliothis virescens ascovirus 3f]AJP09139.1 hypothetical protein [Heliothis virescens ascovirus 3f]
MSDQNTLERTPASETTTISDLQLKLLQARNHIQYQIDSISKLNSEISSLYDEVASYQSTIAQLLRRHDDELHFAWQYVDYRIDNMKLEHASEIARLGHVHGHSKCQQRIEALSRQNETLRTRLGMAVTHFERNLSTSSSELGQRVLPGIATGDLDVVQLFLNGSEPFTKSLVN